MFVGNVEIMGIVFIVALNPSVISVPNQDTQDILMEPHQKTKKVVWRELRTTGCKWCLTEK